MTDAARKRGKIGHNLGIDAARLPASVRDLAEALGLPLVLELVKHFGGCEIHVPVKLSADHKLQALGPANARALVAYCPGERLLVPVSLDKRFLRRSVVALERRGLKRWQIARELNISQRHVRRLANVRRERSQKQMDMFG